MLLVTSEHGRGLAEQFGVLLQITKGGEPTLTCW